MLKTIAVIAAITALAAGCGGGDDATDAQTSPTASAATSSTPVAPTMTVEQVASKVAQVKATMTKLSTDLKPCGVGQVIAESPIEQAEALTCSYVAARAPLDAQAAAKALNISSPPAEVAELLKQTRASAVALGRQKVSACESDPMTAECAGVLVKLSSAVDSYLTQLAGWAPYGVA